VAVWIRSRETWFQRQLAAGGSGYDRVRVMRTCVCGVLSSVSAEGRVQSDPGIRSSKLVRRCGGSRRSGCDWDNLQELTGTDGWTGMDVGQVSTNGWDRRMHETSWARAPIGRAQAIAARAPTGRRHSAAEWWGACSAVNCCGH
jgi:hypothetical protein